MLQGFTKTSWFNVIILVTSLGLALLLAEVLLRVLVYREFKPGYYLFLSKPALRDQETAFGFQENTQIREAAVHWNGRGFDIIYDTTFSTNNLGLVQKKNFDPAKEAVVLVGDSFTQGSGATPWFYRLEEHWQDSRHQLINLGIMGSGVEQWQAMLSWFARQGQIKHLIICFITDDWKRRRCVVRDNPAGTGFFFVPWNRRDQIVNNLTIYYLDPAISTAALQQQAGAIRKLEGRFSWPQSLRSYQVLRSLWKRRGLDVRQEGIIQNNIKIFKEMVQQYGRERLTLVHIPERGEALQGSYSPLGRQVQELLLAQGLVYLDGLALCGLSGDDYHAQDGHPNASGYDKIYRMLVEHALPVARRGLAQAD